MAKLVYSEDGSKTFFEHKNVQYSDGKIIGLNINHFTIWAVIGSEDGSSFFNYESYYPLINEASLVGTGNEWVELYNPSQEDFSLKGWKLAFDLDLVISKNGANQKYQFKDTDVIKSKDFFTVETGKSWLNNKIDTVQLVSATGMVVNQLGYSDLTKTSTSNLKQGGFEIGTLDSSSTIARVQDGVNYLVKRSGSEVTKNKSNNISEDSTFLGFDW